jgi:hypothetical protein
VRNEIILGSNDYLAAARILAWIARPHRQADAEKVLQQFVMKYAQLRGGKVPKAIKLPKPARLEYRVQSLQSDILKAFEVARWLQAFVLRGDGSEPFFSAFERISKRQLAAQYSKIYAKSEDEIGPIISRLWKRREPYVHMCLAAGNAIGKMHYKRKMKGFDLWLPLFHPDEWVEEAIIQAEGWAQSATFFGIVSADRLALFRR